LIYLRIRAEDKQENRALLDTMNKEYGYNAHPGCHFYWIKFKNTAEFQMNKEIFIELIKKT